MCWTGTYVKNYAAITTWPAGVTATNVQRNSISATANNAVDAWPAGEIDINTSRFIQFAVKANAGSKLTIDSVGLIAGAAGGSGLKYRILYSKNADFSNPVTLADKTTNTSNTMEILSYKPMLQLLSTEGFYLRFYPWYNGTASLKYLCLSNLSITGKAATLNGISNIQDKKTVVFPNPSTGIFNLKSLNQNTRIEISDLCGKIIKNHDLSDMDNKIDLTKYQRGIYIARIFSGIKTESFMLIKN